MALDGVGGVIEESKESSPQQLKMQRLRLALTLLTGLGLAEIMISHWSQSLSLLADAGHVALDAGAIALTLVVVWMGHIAQSNQRNVRWQRNHNRLEMGAALVNSGSLLVLSVGVIIAAIARLRSPATPDSYSTTVLLAAIASFVINGCNALWLQGCSHHDLNLKGAFLHVLADMVGALGVMIGIIAGSCFGVANADAIASLITSVIIVAASLPLVTQSLLSFWGISVPQFCLCQSSVCGAQKQDLEKRLFPSLEQLVL